MQQIARVLRVNLHNSDAEMSKSSTSCAKRVRVERRDCTRTIRRLDRFRNSMDADQRCETAVHRHSRMLNSAIDPSPVTLRLMKAPERDTLSPGERVDYSEFSPRGRADSSLLPRVVCLLLAFTVLPLVLASQKDASSQGKATSGAANGLVPPNPGP